MASGVPMVAELTACSLPKSVVLFLFIFKDWFDRTRDMMLTPLISVKVTSLEAPMPPPEAVRPMHESGGKEGGHVNTCMCKHVCRLVNGSGSGMSCYPCVYYILQSMR